MNTLERQTLVERINGLRKEHGIAPSVIAQKAGVPKNCLLHLLGGGNVDAYPTGKDKETKVRPVYFVRLQQYANRTEDGLLWKMLPTMQLKEVFAAMEEARKTAATRMVVGCTGIGKSYGLMQYKNFRPEGTFIIKCANDHTALDLIKAIARAVGVADSGTRAAVRYRVQGKLDKLKCAGTDPVLALDEAENLKLQALGTLKAMFDELYGTAGIVVVGTPQLMTDMRSRAERAEKQYPQIWSRFAIGLRVLPDIDGFAEVYEQHAITDNKLVKALNARCSSYREISHAITFLLKMAKERDVQNIDYPFAETVMGW